MLQNDPRITLTERHLLGLGFKEVKIKDDHRPGYRIKLPYYPFEIQVTLGNYPISNPNCGIVAIYSPEQEASGIPKYLYKKKVWNARDHKKADNYRIKMPEWTQNVAWYVHTPERLMQIIVALTSMNI